MRWIGFIFAIILSSTNSLGQCPDKSGLMQRIRSLFDPYASNRKEQLHWFLGSLDSMNHCEKTRDSVHAYLNRVIGFLYFNEGNNLKALNYHLNYLIILKENIGRANIDSTELVGGYYWLSEMYGNAGLIEKQLATLDSCIEYSIRQNKINHASVEALYQLTKHYYDVGDYYRCIDYATRCEAQSVLFSKSNEQSDKITAYKYISSSSAWKVNALIALKDYSAAESYLKNKIEDTRREGLNFNLATIYNQMAELQVEKGNYKKAIDLFYVALEYASEARLDFTCKQILNTLGYEIFYDKNLSNVKALQCFQRALRFVNNDQNKIFADKIETLDIYSNIAKVFLRENQFDSANVYIQLAFDQLKPGTSEKDLVRYSPGELIKQKKLHYVTKLMVTKGDAERQQFRQTGDQKYLKAALRTYRFTDQFLDMVRKEQSDFDSKLFWRKETRLLYEKAIDACFLLDEIEGAFYFFEKSKSVLLHDQLTEQKWVKEEDITEQVQLKKNVLELERKIEMTPVNTGEYEDLVKEKFDQNRQLENIQRRIRISNPVYYQNLIDTTLPTVHLVQKSLFPRYSSLIETFVGDSMVYILALSNNGNFIERIEKDKYEKLVFTYNQYLSNQDALNRNYYEFNRLAAELFKLIFNNHSLPPGRLIISPDGPNFPYESLVASKIGEHIKYLVEDYAVSYTYSIRYLLTDMSVNNGLSARDFVGVAPLKFEAGFSLAPLEGSDQSLNRLDGFFRHSLNIIGSKATRNRFMKEFSRYKVVQLYTHASDSGIYREPVIFFNDSSLLLSDLIYASKPQTRLIVLSACETGSGKFYKGEGVFSFSRGFASLGVPSAITNLWSVENESTYRLTELFYKYLVKGLPLDIALQKAKIEFLHSAPKEKRLPYYWAAQILAGHSDPVNLKKPLPWEFLITGAMVLTIVAGTWILRKRKSLNPVRGKAGMVASGV